MYRANRIMLLAIAGLWMANPTSVLAEEKEEKMADPYEGMPTVIIKGTDKTASFTVNPKSLGEDIIIRVPEYFEASPSMIPAGTQKQTVTVRYTGTNAHKDGCLILKSGETKSYVHLVGEGTPIPVKNELTKVSTDGEDFKKSFTPGKNGYTYEIRLASNEDGFEFVPYFVDANGSGLKLYIDDSSFGYINARNKRGFSNPSTQGKPGGTGRFYNNDGKSHTYRVAVTPDNLAFIYRDGIAIDTLNVAMISPQPEFGAVIADMQENLLRNGDFEGGYTASGTDKLVTRLDGWDVVIGDRWNSEQYIENQEMSSDIDNDNHVFKIRPYKWAGGWGDGSIEQVIDVAPNETYTLEVLAHGGLSAKQGKNTGRIAIRELQPGGKKVDTEIASDQWEAYSLDLTTSPDCKQIAVSFSVGKGTWGGDITPVYVDNARLVGRGCEYKPQFGFNNNNATIEYVAFDETGAYAPSQPGIDVKVK